MKKEFEKVIDVLLIIGAVFLAYNNIDGWGWLLFILVFKKYL
jgi:hypothetical protein